MGAMIYQYDNDSTNSCWLPIAAKIAGYDEYIPKPHIITKEKSAMLLESLSKNVGEDKIVLKKEQEFFKTILNGVIKGDNVLVVKTYM